MTRILITGAGRGIGFELAKQSIEKGWDVVGSVRSVDAQRKLAQELPQMAVLNFDVTDYPALEKIANAFHSPIDILVNCAGIITPDRQSTLDMDFEGFAKTLEVNVLAPLKVAQVFLPLIRESQNGRIINISSQMGRMEFSASDRIAYRASKAALNKVTQGLATDLQGKGVSVIAMHPGWVSTDMGGAQAPVTPQESAAGILKVAEGLGIEETGKFIDWDGTPRSW
ncbi:MAG: SDR family oxidoreductase [Rhizobiaceae bacterium]|nr:SDR family oxidoreductase [Rhizobiaceae bacterium]